MARTMKQFIASLPQAAQEAIAQETARLVAEEMTLRELRKAREVSQRTVGENLHVNQAAVSKIERRTDMYISTLREYIEAMGGELDIIARFPDRPPVRINQFEELGDSEIANREGVLVAANAAYAELAEDPEAQAEVNAERRAWDATLADGLDRE